MNNEEIFNLGSAFLVNTALLVGFILVIWLSYLPQWQKVVNMNEVDEASTVINSCATLIQKP